MRFRGTVYRAHNPEWAWTPLSGEGTRRYGGRFNRRGKPAFCSSLAQITAIREATPLGRPTQPLTLCAYEVDAEPVFDATDPMRLRQHRLVEADLACPTWEADMLERGVAASQVLAERLVAAGYVGMLVPSFAIGTNTEDLNLVMWHWGDSYPSCITLIDEEGRLSLRKR